MGLERKFRWQLCFIQSRLLTPLVWLLSKRVPDFGRFGSDEIDPLTPEQHTAIAKAEPIAGGKKVESLLTAGALQRAAEVGKTQGQESSFYFLEKCGAEFGDFGEEPITAADAEERPSEKAQFADAPPEVLRVIEVQRIERWKTILAVSAGAAGLVGFLVAMVSFFLAR